jgi:hypothetical protein
MRIHNLYAGPDGLSHFRDVEVEWAEERHFSKLSRRLPATGIVFRETGGDYDLDWHPAPRRQYIINLDAGVEITTGRRASSARARCCWWRTPPARRISPRPSAAGCAARCG